MARASGGFFVGDIMQFLALAFALGALCLIGRAAAEALKDLLTVGLIVLGIFALPAIWEAGVAADDGPGALLMLVVFGLLLMMAITSTNHKE